MMPVELATSHINMNVLDETKTSLRRVRDSIIAEWSNYVTSLKNFDSEAELKKQQVIDKAYAVLATHATKSNEDIMQACNGGGSCLLFALQIILVEAKLLSGRKCVDGIYGEQTKLAIIAYKKNVLGYTRANGSIHGKFLQQIGAKRGSGSVTPPNIPSPPPVPKAPLGPTPLMPGPYNSTPPESPPFDPLNPFPRLPPKKGEAVPVTPTQGLDGFIASLDQKYRPQAEVFIKDISQQYAKSCDPRVENPFSVGTSSNGNPVLRITTAPGRTITLSYPLRGLSSLGEAKALFNHLCTYLNTQKNTIFYT